jgi:hypothetical protein
MSERFPFQYSILRYTHDVGTGEFLNVGLVLYSKSARFFQSRLLLRYRRLTQTFPGADGEFYRRYISHLQRSLNEVSTEVGSDQMQLFGEGLPDRIEFLLQRVLPLDDSSIQFSEVRGGLADDLEAAFDQLYYRLVEQYVIVREAPSREDDDIWQVFRPPLQESGVLDHLQRYEVYTEVESFQFDHAWKNGRWNVLKPLSFDLVHPGNIRRKAREWMGAAHIMEEAQDLSGLFFLLGHPSNPSTGDKLVQKAYSDAVRILKRTPVARLKLELVEEDDAQSFARRLRRELGDGSSAT